VPIQTLRKVLKAATFARGESWLLAVSGGADSVFLLRAMVELQPEFGWQLHAAHLNHSLRGSDSDDDATFVRGLCAELGVPLIEESLPAGSGAPPGESPEAWARERRYEFLERARGQADAARIALAHHADDQAETLLMRFLTGSGPTGLSGMQAISRDGRRVRPLLGIRRREILEGLRERGWAHREDLSNLDTSTPRNFLRHRIVPALEEGMVPALTTTLGHSAEIFRQWVDFAEQLADAALLEARKQGSGGILELERAALLKYPQVVRKFVLGKALRGISGTRGVSRAHLDAMDDLLASNEGGRRICLPRNLEAAREGDRLVVYRAEPTPSDESYPLSVPGGAELAGGLSLRAARVKGPGVSPGPDPDRLWLDPERLEGGLVVRRRRPGDRFAPWGLGSEIKLKDFLISARVPARLRRHLWVLSDSRSVLWVLGMRQSERVRMDTLPEELIEVRLERRAHA
jgi:tRNA(Ile)-lysidine synthase